MHTTPCSFRRSSKSRSELLLSIDIDAVSARLSVGAVGELDLAGGRRLREAIEPFLGEVPVHVKLDLGAVSFADSSGAMSVVDLAGRVRRSGGTLDITRCSNAVVRIFDILMPPAPRLSAS